MGAFIVPRTDKDSDGAHIISASSGKRRWTLPPLTSLRRKLRHIRYSIEDWVYLALLGVITALTSLAMELIIEQLNNLHYFVYDMAHDIDFEVAKISATYLIWVSYSMLLVGTSAVITHYFAMQAIGSGIPEMKTILRGVILKEYLTLRTLVTKVAGLTLALGSGLPIGKEGPFVHISSIVASQLSRLVDSFKSGLVVFTVLSLEGIYENESRASEMLAAGCAAGVACTFSSPIGGVLFSIEVTSVFFAVRNYWRGFFAAASAAVITRIIIPYSKGVVDLNAMFQTHFVPGKTFTLVELPLFALIGLFMGLLGAAFILCHRRLTLFLRKNPIAKGIFNRYWWLYALLVPFVISTVSYPEGLGQFMAGRTKFSKTIGDLFSDCTWSAEPWMEQACHQSVTEQWKGLDNSGSIFLSLAFFQISYFFFSVVCSTLPVPSGVFMPVIVLGAVFGRLFGETVSVMHSGGCIVSFGSSDCRTIHPGVYSLVGAAALAGAVTHTVSVCVIIFEVTGQLLYLLPVVVAVLISNAVCAYFQPSIYDSIIRIKHLPYLPDIRHTSSVFHSIMVDRIMNSPVQHISRDSTYGHAQSILTAMPRVKAFPIVDSDATMILLGSVSRQALIRILDLKVGTETRQAEASRRVRAAIDRATEATKRVEELEEARGRPRSRFTILPAKEEPVEDSHMEKLKRIHAHVKKSLQPEEGRGEGGLLSPPPPDTPIHSLTIGGILNRMSEYLGKREGRGAMDIFDLFGEERDSWESVQLSSPLDLATVPIDPSPFQLVSHTSLFKVHSLFSLLGLHRAYVTEAGQLVGVVALREVREAIEKAQNGMMCPHEEEEDEEKEMEEAMSETTTPPNDEDEDSSDYEDNLQPKLEIVRPVFGTSLDEDSDDHAPFAFSINSIYSLPASSGVKPSTWKARRLAARRDSTRMDEMTTRRRSSVGAGRRESMQLPRFRPLSDDEAPATLDSPFSASLRDGSFATSLASLYGEAPFEKSLIGSLAPLQEEPPKSTTPPETLPEVSVTTPIDEEREGGDEERADRDKETRQ